MDEILASLGGVSAPVRITLKMYEGVRMLDIRKYYKDKKSLDFTPSSKGISLTQGSFNELIDRLNENSAKINSWLNDPDSIDGGNELLQQQAKIKSLTIPKSIDISYVEDKNNLAYAVTSQGSAAKVVFNLMHPYVKAITKKEKYTKNEVENIISNLIVGLHIAKFKSEVDGSKDGNIIDFNSMNYLCSKLLEKSYKE